VIGRLGGWSGYVGGGYKPPGPKTMYAPLTPKPENVSD
jgi:hypothetical protein